MRHKKLKIALPYLSPGKGSGQGVFEETFAARLDKRQVRSQVFYPTNKELRKIPKIGGVLTMASLREHYDKLAKFDIIYCTDGTAISLLEGELKKRIIPVYHCSAYTQWQKITVNENKLPDIDNYRKYATELHKLELTSPEVSSYSHEAIGLCSVQMARNAKNIIVVSENVKKELVELGANPKKISVIENGIEKQWFEPVEKCRRCDEISKKWNGKPVVMWMGRVGSDRLNFKIKGIDRILEVMSRLDNKKVHKVVIGLVPKAYEDSYRHLFEKRGIEFIANCSYNHLPHLARKGNIFLGTSRYEACQLSLLESMASGLAPVTYNIGVVPEAIVHGKNGYIVKNINEMLEKVNYLIEHPKKTQEIGLAAKETAILKHQISDMVDKYLRVFKRAAKKNKLWS